MEVFLIIEEILIYLEIIIIIRILVKLIEMIL